MKCIVVNLDRAAARRKAMVEQLQSLHMQFEILKAKDWKELTERDYASIDTATRERQGRRPLSRSMIACSISHRRVLAELAAGGADMVAILEDDVTLSSDFGSILLVLENTDINFDIIFLHRNKLENTFTPIERIGKHGLGLIKYSDWGAMGYVITRSAAQRYFECFPKIVHQFDHSLHAYWEHGLKSFSLDPPILHHGIQSERYSFLQETSVAMHSRSLGSLIRRVRTELLDDLQRRRVYRQRTRRKCNIPG